MQVVTSKIQRTEKCVREELDMLKWFELFMMIRDRKSTRLNSSHVRISYAVFCLKKKKTARVGAPPPALVDQPSRADAHASRPCLPRLRLPRRSAAHPMPYHTASSAAQP